jgi:hypothetical protein
MEALGEVLDDNIMVMDANLQFVLIVVLMNCNIGIMVE